jgi:hypothetical protein
MGARRQITLVRGGGQAGAARVCAEQAGHGSDFAARGARPHELP